MGKIYSGTAEFTTETLSAILKVAPKHRSEDAVMQAATALAKDRTLPYSPRQLYDFYFQYEPTLHLDDLVGYTPIETRDEAIGLLQLLELPYPIQKSDSDQNQDKTNSYFRKGKGRPRLESMKESELNKKYFGDITIKYLMTAVKANKKPIEICHKANMTHQALNARVKEISRHPSYEGAHTKWVKQRKESSS